MNPLKTSRLKAAWRVAALLAAILAGPAVICSSLWYAQHLLPVPGTEQAAPASPNDGGTDGDAPVQPNGSTLIEVTGVIPNEYPEAVALSALQTVPLKANFQDGHAGFGTGFLYQPGIIITAAHIIESGGRDNLTGILVFCGGRNAQAAILAHDPLRDVTVLGAADCDGYYLLTENRPFAEKERLYVAGFSYAEREGRSTAARYLRPVRGKPQAVAKIRHPHLQDPRTARMISEAAAKKIPRLRAIDTEFAPGNSGSPVLTGDGAVIGMIVLVDQMQGLTFCVPAGNLIHVLRAAGVE